MRHTRNLPPFSLSHPPSLASLARRGHLNVLQKPRALVRRQARPRNHVNSKESYLVDAAQRTLKGIDTHPPPPDTTHTRARHAYGCQLTNPTPYTVNPEPARAASMTPQRCTSLCWRCTAESPCRLPESLGAVPQDASRSANKTASLSEHLRCREANLKTSRPHAATHAPYMWCSAEPPLPAKAPCAISRRQAGECARGQGILMRPPRCRQASPA